MAKASVQGGYECEFVVDPPKELQYDCPICLYVIREPHLVECCGYRFCKTCINNIQDKGKPCPLCNATFTTLPDKFLQRTLLGRNVTCTNKEEGCEWTGELRDLENHLNEEFSHDRRLDGCDFVEIKCPYCKKLYYRREIEDHEGDCPEKQVCKHCNNYNISMDDLINKHWPKCPAYPILCPNGCGKCFERASIKDHVKEDCPLTVVKCEFEKMGCKIVFARRDLNEHMERFALHHISLLVEHIEKLNQRIEQYVKSCSELFREIDEKDEEIAENAQEIFLNADELFHLEADVFEKDEEIAEKHFLIAEKDKEIARINWVVADKDKQIAGIKRMVADKDKEIAGVKQVIADKDKEIAELKKRKQELSQASSKANYVLLVTNCPSATSEQKLKGIFGQFGLVRQLEWNAEFKYGLVYYFDLESIQKALDKYRGPGIRLHHTKLEIRQI